MQQRCYKEVLQHLSLTFGIRWKEDRAHANATRNKGRAQARQQGGKRSLNQENQQRHIQLMLENRRCCEVLVKLCNSTWWEWDLGSSLFYWRWGQQYRLALEGTVPFISGTLPRSRRKSRAPSNKTKFDLITAKLETIIKRQYITPGYVTSLTDFFDVPKGDNDIRMVYNGTSCGLNKAIWTPNFWLPYPRSAISLLDFGYYSVDVDFSDMFLNFPLHQSLQPYSGIDLTPYQKVLELETSRETTTPGQPNMQDNAKHTRTTWYRWNRNWMGARGSPYSSVQFCSLAEEFACGDPHDRINHLRWDNILLNLPGSQSYNPAKPRVIKWDKVNRRIAGSIIIFVDDLRGCGATVEHAWAIARQVVSRFQYLGMQDATRKRKPPSQTPGAWAGAVMASTGDKITKTVSKEKWAKGKEIVKSLWVQLQDNELASN